MVIVEAVPCCRSCRSSGALVPPEPPARARVRCALHTPRSARSGAGPEFNSNEARWLPLLLSPRNERQAFFERVSPEQRQAALLRLDQVPEPENAAQDGDRDDVLSTKIIVQT